MYSPTTSRTLASSSGSVENVNVSTRHGCRSHVRQIVATVALPIPSSPELARALHASGLVAVSAPPGGGRTLLKAGSTVGTVRIGHGDDSVDVHVRPKVGVPKLLWLLGHAREQSGWRDEPSDLATTDDVGVAAAVWFAHRARRALAGGVHRDYVTVVETLPGLRGRLREADQMRRHLGLTLPLEVQYDD